MAKQGGSELYNAKDLSVAIDIPLPTVSKVLKILTQGGILESHQGSKGGYTLVRPASQISAVEVLEAIEGPVAITDCSSEEGCERNCHVSQSWQKVNGTIIGALNKLSLADMAG
jgi:Rrf2 family protein